MSAQEIDKALSDLRGGFTEKAEQILSGLATLPAVTKALEDIAREIADEINAEETGLDTYPQVLRAMQLALRAGQPDETAKLREEIERLKREHCRDCCCARSWRALGVDVREQDGGFVGDYDGRSIPERIEDLRAQLAAALAAVRDKDELLRPLVKSHLQGFARDGIKCTCTVCQALAKQPDASALEEREKPLVEAMKQSLTTIENARIALEFVSDRYDDDESLTPAALTGFDIIENCNASEGQISNLLARYSQEGAAG